ncbi:HNH endonuclease [Serpentinicella sp. ANB-PHB4]|uniref:HNH endonuclease n=1 Tax=Serpentinicella sp. ANB-PHB4 TaxID=3074076 RepID=UPI00285EFFB7|nr:HNH endonuclease [Serpentinicella sp. ANB-PHB4]MDR5659011.1 HNH endonuclease [Serpentinicella sp. ANB-PHB4]
MIDITDENIKVDIFLKVKAQEHKNIFDIIYEHIKVTKRNPSGYTWWGNNQPFSPEKLSDFFMAGQKPQALIVIPSSQGGNDNIRYIADILDAEKYTSPSFPSDDWRPEYYMKDKHKTWLKLANFIEIDSSNQEVDISDYYLISNDELLKSKLKSQYACGYVYKIISNEDAFTNAVRESKGNYDDSQKQRGFLEGKKNLKKHITIERNQSLIKEAKKEFKKNHGKLFCEICEFDFSVKYNSLGKDFIEGHHKKPISLLDGKEIEMKIEDIAMLCSNCHSMIHRKKDCFTIDEVKEAMFK